MVYLRIRHLLGNKTGQSLLAFGALSAGSYVHIALLARAYPEEEFGRWAFFLAGNTLLDGLRSGLVQPWLVKFTQGEDGLENVRARRAVLSLVIWLTLFLAGVILLCYFLYGRHHPDALGFYFFKWFWLAHIVQLPNLIAAWQLMLERDFARLFLVRGVFLGCFAGFCLVNFRYPLAMDWVLVAYIVAQGLSSLLAYSLGYVSAMTWVIHRRYWRRLWRFSTSTVTSSLLVTGQHFFEISMVALFFDPAAVALYALPLRVLNGYDLILRALLANYFPLAGKLTTSAWRRPFVKLMDQYAFGTGGVFLLISALVVVFSEHILMLLGGEKYVMAWPILTVMAFGMIFQPMAKVFGSALEVTGRPYWNTWLLGGAIFCTVLAIWGVGLGGLDMVYVALAVTMVKVLHGLVGWYLAHHAARGYFRDLD